MVAVPLLGRHTLFLLPVAQFAQRAGGAPGRSHAFRSIVTAQNMGVLLESCTSHE